MGGENHEQFRQENVVRLSTGAFKIQLSASAFEYIRGAGTRPFDISPFGTWAIAGRATPLGSSLVVAGIPKDLDEIEVVTALVVGTERMLPEPVCQCARVASATAEEAGAVGRGSGRGSYGTPGSKRGAARAATRIRPVPVLPGVRGSGLD